MKTSTRVGLGFGTLLVLLLPVVGYLTYAIHGVVELNQVMSRSGTRMLVTSWEQMEELHRYRENAQKWWITGDDRYRALADSAWSGFAWRLDELEALPALGDERLEIERLRALWEAAGGDAPEGGSVVPSAVVPRDALLVLDARLGPLREQARRVHDAGREAMRAEARRSEVIAARAGRLAAGIAPAAVLLGLLVAGLVIRSLSRSLAVLRAGTRAVARGDFEHRLDEERTDELADVARDFNRMTERLGELDRLKRDFVSHVSHELKTPLASMQEIHHALLDELAGPLTERQRRQLELNLKSGSRLSRMITHLLDLSRLESGTVEYDLEEGDLAAALREVLAPFEARSPATAARLDVRLPARPVPARFDGEYLARAIDNLVENALKYAPPESTVRITLDHERERPADVPEAQRGPLAAEAPGWALLRVDDEGPGVAPADRDVIFQRFVRLPGPPGRKRPGGVGLGLALSREIVRAQGGALWVEERPEGPGARFSILLPAVASPTPPLAAADPPRPAATPAGRTA